MMHSVRGCESHAVIARYALFAYSTTHTFLTISFTNYKFRKMHSAVLQLEVRILGAHKSQNKMGRLNILFPILAEKAKAEEYITTLRELEFEQLENPDPKELVSHNRRG